MFFLRPFLPLIVQVFCCLDVLFQTLVKDLLKSKYRKTRSQRKSVNSVMEWSLLNFWENFLCLFFCQTVPVQNVRYCKREEEVWRWNKNKICHSWKKNGHFRLIFQSVLRLNQTTSEKVHISKVFCISIKNWIPSASKLLEHQENCFWMPNVGSTYFSFRYICILVRNSVGLSILVASQ